jgi:hypothetical protein
MSILEKLSQEQSKFVKEYARLGFKNQGEALWTIFPKKGKEAVYKQAMRWMRESVIKDAIEFLKQESRIEKAEKIVKEKERETEIKLNELSEKAKTIFEGGSIINKKSTTLKLFTAVGRMTNNVSEWVELGRVIALNYLLDDVILDQTGKITAFSSNTHRLGENFSEFLKLFQPPKELPLSQNNQQNINIQTFFKDSPPEHIKNVLEEAGIKDLFDQNELREKANALFREEYFRDEDENE